MKNLISNILNIALSPLTILIKFITEAEKSGSDESEGFLAFISIVFWLVFVLIGWVFVAASATPLFLIVTCVVGYLLTLQFFFNFNTANRHGEFLTFVFFIMAAIVAGYTFGLLGHFFFLLY